MTAPYVLSLTRWLRYYCSNTSFDYWVGIYQLQKGEVTPKQGKKRCEFEPDIPTKYTKGLNCM
jgi:hypothetical protein